MHDDGAMDWTCRHPRRTLKLLGLHTRHRFGQNFLVSLDAMDRFVDSADLQPGDLVLEIGTGLGRLTVRLADRAGHVVSVEIDDAFHAIAATHLADVPNVTLLGCDFLQSKHRINPTVTDAMSASGASASAPIKVVSNLPYSISSPAIVNLLEWDVPVGQMLLTVQREVAERLTATPGTGEYGPLTVYVDYWATVQRLFTLPRTAFWPRPDVTSAVIRVTPRPERTRTDDYSGFANTVRVLFTSRRKTLSRALRSGWDRELASRLPEELGLDPRMRVEQLRTEDFEAIARVAGPPR